jgi:hypothetical protein
MGGVGSGPQSGSRYGTVEQSRRLDINSLHRAGYLQSSQDVRGTWKWWTDDPDQPTATIGLEIRLAGQCPRYRLLYHVGEKDGQGCERVDDWGDLLFTTPHAGGRRWWFGCRLCHRRARILYFPPGSLHFACRQCHRLKYDSQHETIYKRLLRKAQKLYQRAGITDATEPWHRPKRLRAETYYRLVRAAQDAELRAVLAMPLSASLRSHLPELEAIRRVVGFR